LTMFSDGLCATGVQRHAPALIAAALPLLRRAGLQVAPIVVADQARVALGGAIGGAMGAAMVAVLIGERPGLTALDSLGAYLTWDPRPGRTDAERNCISNIRPGGQSPRQAAEKLAWLAGAALQLGETGVGLKDEQPAVPQFEVRYASVLPSPEIAGRSTWPVKVTPATFEIGATSTSPVEPVTVSVASGLVALMEPNTSFTKYCTASRFGE